MKQIKLEKILSKLTKEEQAKIKAVITAKNENLLKAFKEIIETAKSGIDDLKADKFEDAISAAGAIVIYSKDLHAAMKMRKRK